MCRINVGTCPCASPSAEHNASKKESKGGRQGVKCARAYHSILCAGHSSHALAVRAMQWGSQRPAPPYPQNPPSKQPEQAPQPPTCVRGMRRSPRKSCISGLRKEPRLLPALRLRPLGLQNSTAEHDRSVARRKKGEALQRGWEGGQARRGATAAQGATACSIVPAHSRRRLLLFLLFFLLLCLCLLFSFSPRLQQESQRQRSERGLAVAKNGRPGGKFRTWRQ